MYLIYQLKTHSVIIHEYFPVRRTAATDAIDIEWWYELSSMFSLIETSLGRLASVC